MLLLFLLCDFRRVIEKDVVVGGFQRQAGTRLIDSSQVWLIGGRILPLLYLQPDSCGSLAHRYSMNNIASLLA